MKLPKNGFLLGLIIIIIYAAISLIVDSVLMVAIAAGLVGYQYSHQYKRGIAYLHKLIASCIPGFLAILLISFQYFAKSWQEIFQILPGRSIVLNIVMLALVSIVLPAMLIYFGLLTGEKMGLKKSL